MITQLTHNLYYHSFGRAFRVAAIATTVDEANQYCEQNPTCGVIDVDAELIVIAENESTIIVGGK